MTGPTKETIPQPAHLHHKKLYENLRRFFVTTRIVAFERKNFICRKQKKAESFENFLADLVELASRDDCGDRDDERESDMCTAHMHNEKMRKNC